MIIEIKISISHTIGFAAQSLVYSFELTPVIYIFNDFYGKFYKNVLLVIVTIIWYVVFEYI